MSNAFGGVGLLGIERAIMMTMQPSLTNMTTLKACKQDLLEKSQTKQDEGARCKERK